MSVAIDAIFTKNRFVSGPTLLFVILYAPLGIVLFTLRVFISLQLCLASLVLPSGTFIRKIVLRILCTVMGIVVREKDWHKKDDKCRIVIANHITPFDHLAVSLVCPCISVSVYNLPAPLSAILCYKDMGMGRGRDVMKTNIQSYLDKPDSIPMLLHPEGATTNGSVALMKYGSWAFEFDSSVLVLGLKVHRIPILPIAPSVLGSSWPADMFYILFSPVTIYTVRYIGKMTKQESETAEQFSSRIQSATAAAMNLQTSNHNVADKVEYVKRLAREAAASANPYLNPEIHSMSLQVKEVLPYLPLDMIKRDIIRTRSVDVTITNFLEGNIPEPIPSAVSAEPTAAIATAQSIISATTASYSHTSQPSGDSLTATDIPVNTHTLNTAAKTFGSSAQKRMQSFQERKANLIATARQKYIEQHGLKIPGVNC